MKNVAGRVPLNNREYYKVAWVHPETGGGAYKGQGKYIGISRRKFRTIEEAANYLDKLTIWPGFPRAKMMVVRTVITHSIVEGAAEMVGN